MFIIFVKAIIESSQNKICNPEPIYCCLYEHGRIESQTDLTSVCIKSSNGLTNLCSYIKYKINLSTGNI